MISSSTASAIAERPASRIWTKRGATKEAALKGEVLSLSAFCRNIIRKARRQVPVKSNAACGYVYMLRNGYFIKIGHSFDPAERLRKINTSSPDDCELLFCFPGGAKLEREMHREFSACHYKREWFFLCGKLKHFVSEFEASRLSPQQVSRNSHDVSKENA